MPFWQQMCNCKVYKVTTKGFKAKKFVLYRSLYSFFNN